NLHEGIDKRFTISFAKQCMDQFECDTYTSKILIGITTTRLIRIEHSECWRSAYSFVRQMMIGNDYVEPVVARPVEGFVRTNAAINANHQLVTFPKCLFQRGLLNSVAFRETVWNVIARFCTQHL